ncbi:hypothetical protein [Pseudoalteromonas sp. S16_S37]|uniref:hypothetical protein n=1 Tax=Pseudoalteromonas sp. S16_S37 TaxID=2720228 RepID=UPI00168089FA|nr:hypothetical protein [Pseudoalteromonas sp. S16_S37]MBD1582506.1 hypothetical protein [Pseudoalteromonas sp. S16_S37]
MATNAELSLSLLIKETTTATRELSKLEEQVKKSARATSDFADDVDWAKKSLAGFLSHIKGASKNLIWLHQDFKTAKKSASSFGKEAGKSFSQLEQSSDKAKGRLAALEDQLRKNIKASKDLNSSMGASGSASSSVSADSNKKVGGSPFKKSLAGIGSFAKGVAGAAGAPLLLADAVVAAGQKTIAVTSQFEALEARINVVAASSEKSKEIFHNLKEMAEATPHGIEQTTNAFLALYNNGLTPTKEAMTAYGDIASAMGMSLLDVSSNVINATSLNAKTQETAFANLGINAKATEEGLALTYNGVTTNIKDNTESIQQYFNQLAQSNFAGAMAEQMDMMGGRVQRFQSEWNELFLNISNAGLGDVIKSSLTTATDALDTFNDSLVSGQLGKYVDAYLGPLKSGFSMLYKFTLGDELEAALGATTGFFAKALENWGGTTEKGLLKLSLNYVLIPESVSSAISMASQEFNHWMDRFDSATGYALKGIKNGVTSASESLYIEFKKSVGKLNPFHDSFDYEQEKNQAAENKANRDKELQNLKENDPEKKEQLASSSFSDRFKSYQEQMQKRREALTKEFYQKLDEGDKLGKAYDEKQQSYADNYNNAKNNTEIGLKPAKGPKASSGLTNAGAKNDVQTIVSALDPKSDNTSAQKNAEETEKLLTQSCERQRGIVESSENQQTQIQTDLIKKRHEKIIQLERQKNAQLASEASGFMSQLQNLGDSLNGDLTNPENVEEAIRATVGAFESGKSLITDIFGSEEDEEDESGNLDSFEEKSSEELDRLQSLNDQKADLEVESEAEKNQEIEQLEQNRMQSQLGASSSFFGQMSGLAKNYAGEQSKAYKGLYAVSKAFSITQGVMSIATGIARANELGFPANIAEMARVAATGASVMSTIKGANFSGAYDHGGLIPAGKIGLVGEYGPELIAGPINVTSRRTTAGLNTSNSAAEQTPQNIDKSVKFNYVINANDSDGVAQVMKRERAKIMQDVRYAMESGEWD